MAPSGWRPGESVNDARSALHPDLFAVERRGRCEPMDPREEVVKILIRFTAHSRLHLLHCAQQPPK
jgi:hypothetical protein